MITKTYVAIFSEPLDRPLLEKCVLSWIERFEKVEQLVPQNGFGGDYGLEIKSVDDLMWSTHLQFRITQGIDFSWVYITLNRPAIETSTLPTDDISLGLDLLLELPLVTEIVDGNDDRRLDRLEAEGLL